MMEQVRLTFFRSQPLNVQERKSHETIVRRVSKRWQRKEDVMKVIKAKLLTDTITPDFLYDTQPPYAKDKVATHIDICWTTRGGRNYNQVTGASD